MKPNQTIVEKFRNCTGNRQFFAYARNIAFTTIFYNVTRAATTFYIQMRLGIVSHIVINEIYSCGFWRIVCADILYKQRNTHNILNDNVLCKVLFSCFTRRFGVFPHFQNQFLSLSSSLSFFLSVSYLFFYLSLSLMRITILSKLFLVCDRFLLL